MSDNAAVSVIIPAYNNGKYLVHALESVFSQKEPPFEVIVVDDGSTDDTAAVVKQFGGCIKYIYQPNGGPAAARNRGAQEAKGEWIAFLDADDAWLPWRISAGRELISRNPSAALFCGRRTDMNNSVSEPAGGDFNKTRIVILREFARGNIVATSTVLMRKDAFVRAGGFDEQFRGPEDYDLWMRLAGDNRLVYVDIPLCRYRSISGSLSMEDRLFLPQVVRVIDKAFAKGGALQDFPGLKGACLADQYLHASWMAFERGSKSTALRYLSDSFKKGWRFVSIDLRCMRFLFRYLFGPGVKSL